MNQSINSPFGVKKLSRGITKKVLFQGATRTETRKAVHGKFQEEAKEIHIMTSQSKNELMVRDAVTREFLSKFSKDLGMSVPFKTKPQTKGQIYYCVDIRCGDGGIT